MEKEEFIEKHIKTNYTDASEREKTIVRTAFYLGCSYSEKSNSKRQKRNTKCKHNGYSYNKETNERICVDCGTKLTIEFLQGKG